MIKKLIKTAMVSCSLGETWKHKKINTECWGNKTRHHSSCHTVASWDVQVPLWKSNVQLGKTLKEKCKLWCCTASNNSMSVAQAAQ